MEPNYQSWGDDLRLFPEQEDSTFPDFSSNFQTKLVFDSREELIKHVNDLAMSLSFLMKIESSNKFNMFQRPKLTLSCERSGSYESNKVSSKDTGTKKCNCPFRLKGRKPDKIWMLEVVCGSHNHSLITYMEGHAIAARLTEREKEIVRSLSAPNIKSRQILAAIKEENPDNKSTIKTINNYRATLKIKDNEGRSSVQQLLHLLESKAYVWNLRSDSESDELQDIFFAHPRSIEILKAFPYVLLMDCTYKTNRFRLPLFQIAGVSSTEKTFSVAFVLMQSEKKDNYLWALRSLRTILGDDQLPRVILTDRDLALMQALDVVFRSSNALLCTFHISKNVYDKARKSLGCSLDGFCNLWTSIVNSATFEEYEKNILKMSSSYKRFPAALKYTNELLENHKEKFVACWTDQSMHYGNRTTNRVESQHARLKRYLENSQGNLAIVFDYIDQVLNTEATEIMNSLERSRNYVQHYYTDRIFKQLRGHVSTPALKKIKEEMCRCDYIANSGIEYCGCRLRITHGLPCAHELLTYRTQSLPIPLDSIDAFWKKLDFSSTTSTVSGLDCRPDLEKYISVFEQQDPFKQAYMLRLLRESYDPAKTPVTDPQQKKQGRGRPSGKKFSHQSTRREHSAWEYPRTKPMTPAGRHSFHTSFEPKPSPHPKRQSFHASEQKHTSFRYDDHFSDNQPSHDSVETPNFIGEVNRYAQFSSIIQRYIIGVNDVQADGNCGYRAIASCLNFAYGEHSFTDVRRDLFTEITSYQSLYKEMFGDMEYSRICDALSFWENTGCLPRHWFSVLEMGHLIASRYNVAFVTLSLSQSQTFLPLKTMVTEEPKIICIGHVNNNHFVEVLLADLAPLPRINPQWSRYKEAVAEGWKYVVQQQVQHYINLETMYDNQ